jgi:arginyl-tRNA synthetase
VHHNPAVATISFVEMQALTDKYQTSVLLEAFRRTGSCVTKERAMAHDRILKAVYNLAERVQTQDTRSKPTVHLQPRPETKVDTALTDLRIEFQNHATLQDWTLTEDQAAEYLHQAGSTEVMREAMQKLRKYSVNEFEDALSALNAAIDQTLWMREVVLQ